MGGFNLFEKLKRPKSQIFKDELGLDADMILEVIKTVPKLNFSDDEEKLLKLRMVQRLAAIMGGKLEVDGNERIIYDTLSKEIKKEADDKLKKIGFGLDGDWLDKIANVATAAFDNGKVGHDLETFEKIQNAAAFYIKNT